jgi:hypothetical protein
MRQSEASRDGSCSPADILSAAVIRAKIDSIDATDSS